MADQTDMVEARSIITGSDRLSMKPICQLLSSSHLIVSPELSFIPDNPRTPQPSWRSVVILQVPAYSLLLIDRYCVSLWQGLSRWAHSPPEKAKCYCIAGCWFKKVFFSVFIWFCLLRTWNFPLESDVKTTIYGFYVHIKKVKLILTNKKIMRNRLQPCHAFLYPEHTVDSNI